MITRARALAPLLLPLTLATAPIVTAEAPAGLSGHWRLNVELSDDPREQFSAREEGRRPMGGGRPGFRDEGRGGRHAGGKGPGGGRGFGGDRPESGQGMAAKFGGHEEMTLAVDERWFSVTGPEGREQRFVLGGTTSNPMGGTTHAAWEGEQLVLRGEPRGEGGPRIDRHYTLAPEGNRLHLLVELETPRGTTLRLNRFYDRAVTEGETP